MSNDIERELEKDDPKFERNPGIHDGLGQCYHALGNWNKAFEKYDTAIEKAP